MVALAGSPTMARHCTLAPRCIGGLATIEIAGSNNESIAISREAAMKDNAKRGVKDWTEGGNAAWYL